MLTITLIGTGKLSFNIMNEILKNKSLHLNQVYGRSMFRPKHISDELDYIKNIKNLKRSDFYFLCVSDDEIFSVSEKLEIGEKVVIHLSGSTDIQDLSKHQNHGVIYPLQTFSYEGNLSFKEIPLLIEANNKKTLQKIDNLAKLFSNKIRRMNSKNRLICHLSGTIANNFSNHMIAVAEKILKSNNIDTELIRPLILQTFKKFQVMSALDAQTGPAARNDKKTISKHIQLLNESDFLHLYKEITKNIKSNELQGKIKKH